MGECAAHLDQVPLTKDLKFVSFNHNRLYRNIMGSHFVKHSMISLIGK